MGSKNCAELLKQNALSPEEANILFVVTNNISPAFICSYIFGQELNLPSLAGISLLILYLPPLIYGAVCLRRIDRGGAAKKQIHDFPEKKPASGSQMNFKIIDAGIMNGFETLTRIGGYIMMFSIIASMLEYLSLSPTAKAVLTGLTEITNGIHSLSVINLLPRHRYLLAIFFTAFGGLSGIAQTSSMIQKTSLSMRRYIRGKLLFAVCSVVLALVVVKLWGL
jgi:hypothetical protein